MSAFRVVSVAAAALFVAVAPLSAALAEDEAVVLEHSSFWRLDADENRCRLARQFGEGENKTLFYMEQWHPSLKVDWLVAGAVFDGYSEDKPTTFAFDDGGDRGEFEFLGQTVEGFGKAVAYKSVVIENPEQSTGRPDEEAIASYLKPRTDLYLDSKKAAGIERLTLSQGGQRDIVLKLTDLEKPLAAMNLCMDSLIRSWGFDVDEQRTVTQGPKPTNMAAVARRIQLEYPMKAARAGAQATFQMRLTIEADGSISDCLLVNTTLADDFDMRKHPCTVFLKQAKFEPARTASGEPVRTYYMQRIAYRMP